MEEDVSFWEITLYYVFFIAAVFICHLVYKFCKYKIINGVWFEYKNEVYYVIPKKYCKGLFKEVRAPDDLIGVSLERYDFKKSFAIDEIGEEP